MISLASPVVDPVVTMCSAVSCKEVAPGHFRMILEAPDIVLRANPGQFVHVMVGKGLDPLLRRPLSISRVYPDSGRFELLFRVVGRGTRALSEVGKGGRVDVMGPLGNGFLIDATMRNAAIVAGGIGVAPLIMLADVIRAGGVKAVALVGARTRTQAIGIPEFQEMGIEVQISTEDGTMGHKGLVTDLLEKWIMAEVGSPSSTGSANNPAGRVGEMQVFACGPGPMVRRVVELTGLYGVRSQVSMEERMACGIGACLGCAVTVMNAQGERVYKRVCKDGPVFRGEEVIFN